MTITALLTRLGALEARLDARRRAEAAGQLALDLGGTSEASRRRQERYRDPRFEDWIVPERGPHDEWVWALNNVFRAVRIRRGRA